mgnify:FL=1
MRNIKHAITILSVLLAVMLTACNRYSDLFEQTDKVVESLYSEYESYGLVGGQDARSFTQDHNYKIEPIGRLVNVRIQHAASSEDYKELCDALKEHYSNDNRVNDVYICNAGTVMIDCRR